MKYYRIEGRIKAAIDESPYQIEDEIEGILREELISEGFFVERIIAYEVAP